MAVQTLRSFRHALWVLVLSALLATACSGQPQLGTANETASDGGDEPIAEPDIPDPPEPTQESAPAQPDADPNDEVGESRPPSGGDSDTEPVPYIPAGRPGSAGAYDDLIGSLAQEVPQNLRAEVPWPDLRNPNPVEAQISIFEQWIWMAEHYPEPVLVQAMTAPGSPSREEVTGIFGELDAENVLLTRTGAGYQAFDHLVVTFESAGLPLWLARDVPEDAVVVYYRDNSDPVVVTDRETGDFIERRDAVPTRAWLSIMVPTEVGWQLWRDQLIEPNDSELEIPDVPPPPGADEDRRDPGV